MKKYKIVEKRSLDYSGNEQSKFFIKKRMLGLWFYAISYEDDISFKIMNIILGLTFSVAINMIFTTPFMFVPSASPLLLPAWVYGLYLGQYISSAMFKDSFYSLSQAENKLKNIIKHSRYKNRTIDVVEVSTSKDKLIMEKKN